MSTSRTYFSKGAIIKDNRPLSFDYVPESLPFREDKLRDLSIKYRPLLFSGIPTNVAITGPVGTGKTVVARRFSQLLKEVAIEAEICIKDVYVNCRQRKTDSMVLLGVVNRRTAPSPSPLCSSLRRTPWISWTPPPSLPSKGPIFFALTSTTGRP
ncbi:hypothetical protein B6U83_05255 [Thermoplasmatales archaeon ex4484_36]|nr:MAG: hypothetical protein B6U83_05255 [Thermoplasmatales archaeon ex4484_36]